MQLIRWDDPLSGMTSLRQQMDDMFNQFFTSMPTSAAALSTAMDIYNEDDKQLVVEVRTPGFDKDDVDVSVHNGILEIKGEKTVKEEDKDKKRTYMMRESNSSFYRRVALPKSVDTDNIDAQFNNGLLRVTLPYRELPAPKRVQISGHQPDGKSETKKISK